MNTPSLLLCIIFPPGRHFFLCDGYIMKHGTHGTATGGHFTFIKKKLQFQLKKCFFCCCYIMYIRIECVPDASVQLIIRFQNVENIYALDSSHPFLWIKKKKLTKNMTLAVVIIFLKCVCNLYHFDFI